MQDNINTREIKRGDPSPLCMDTRVNLYMFAAYHAYVAGEFEPETCFDNEFPRPVNYDEYVPLKIAKQEIQEPDVMHYYNAWKFICDNPEDPHLVGLEQRLFVGERQHLDVSMTWLVRKLLLGAEDYGKKNGAKYTKEMLGNLLFVGFSKIKYVAVDKSRVSFLQHEMDVLPQGVDIFFEDFSSHLHVDFFLYPFLDGGTYPINVMNELPDKSKLMAEPDDLTPEQRANEVAVMADFIQNVAYPEYFSREKLKRTEEGNFELLVRHHLDQNPAN